MAFQGFARQEDLSTNQIKIDIDSVINNDLAEANRMSKFMATNASMDQEHRTLYLNALTEKHEKQQDNLRRNFTFYMNNRAKIQEQIAYNNKIKLQDAERSHPYIPSLGDMLGPALMKMAVDVGSAGIKKAFADHAEAKAEAEARDEKETLDFLKLTSLKASKEQNEMRRNPDFIQRVRSDVEEISKAAIAEYDAAGDHKAGLRFARNIYEANKLHIIDRHNTFHSEQLTAIAAQTSIQEFTWNHNGAEITWSDIQAGRYPGSEDAFMDAWEKSFYEERGIHDVGVGAQTRAALGVHHIVSQAQRVIKNNQYKRDTRDYEIQLVSTLESHPGTTKEQMQFVLDPNGTHIGSRKTRGVSLDWLRNHWENYGSSQQIREAMAASFPGVESINQGAPSVRHPAGTKKWQDWNASLAIAVAREEQGRQNTQLEYDGQFNNILDQNKLGLISPQQARVNLEIFGNNGRLNQRLAGASPQVQQSFMEAMRNTAGYGGETSTITAGQKAVRDQITDKEAVDDALQFIKDRKTGGDIATEGIPTNRWNSVKRSIADNYRYWASGVADDLIASGVRPEDVEIELNKIIRTDVKEYTDSLKKLMQADWYHPDDPEVRLKVPYFPNMMKPRGKDAKGFIQEYNADRFAAQKAEQTFGYDDINWNHPIIERWLSQVDRAKRYKHIDLQNVLSNAPQAIKHVVNTQKFSSAGQVYQAALDHGVGYGDKYTRLSESDYMDYNEVQQQYNTLGSQFSKLDERAKAVVLARQAANGGEFPYSENAKTPLSLLERQQQTIQMGKSLINEGYSMWQHPNFNYEKGFVEEGGQRVMPRNYESGHNTNTALDFPLSHNSWQSLDALAERLRSQGWKVLWRSPGHHDHLHAEPPIRGVKYAPITVDKTSVTGSAGTTADVVPIQFANPSLEEQNRLLTAQDNPPEWYGRSRPVDPDKQIPTGWRRWFAGGADFAAKQLGLEGIDLDRRGY